MITSPDTGVARCHAEAEAVIRYAVPGASVRFYEPQMKHWAQDNNPARDRCYQIALTLRLGDAPCVETGMYSLPAPVHQLAASARRGVEAAIQRTNAS